jgi:hypothetical protein
VNYSLRFNQEFPKTDYTLQSHKRDFGVAPRSNNGQWGVFQKEQVLGSGESLAKPCETWPRVCENWIMKQVGIGFPTTSLGQVAPNSDTK